MGFFQNEVEIVDPVPVYTNPQNRAIIAGELVQVGKKYYNINTIWNYIKYVFFNAFRLLIRRIIRYNPSNKHRGLLTRFRIKSPSNGDSDTKSV